MIRGPIAVYTWCYNYSSVVQTKHWWSVWKKEYVTRYLTYNCQDTVVD